MKAALDAASGGARAAPLTPAQPGEVRSLRERSPRRQERAASRSAPKPLLVKASPPRAADVDATRGRAANAEVCGYGRRNARERTRRPLQRTLGCDLPGTGPELECDEPVPQRALRLVRARKSRPGRAHGRNPHNSALNRHAHRFGDSRALGGSGRPIGLGRRRDRKARSDAYDGASREGRRRSVWQAAQATT